MQASCESCTMFELTGITERSKKAPEGALIVNGNNSYNW